MNEVFAGLGCLNFPVMTIWGGSAAKKLPSNMVSRSCIRKSINQSNNSRTEFQKSLFEIEARLPFPLGVEC